MDIVEQVYMGYLVGSNSLHDWLRPTLNPAPREVVTKKCMALLFRSAVARHKPVEGPWIQLFHAARVLRDHELGLSTVRGDESWIDTVPVLSDSSVACFVKAYCLVKYMDLNKGFTIGDVEGIVRSIRNRHPWPEVQVVTRDLLRSADPFALQPALIAAHFRGHPSDVALRATWVQNDFSDLMRRQSDWNDYQRSKRAES